MKQNIILYLIFFISSSIQAQIDGTIFIKNYLPSDYKASIQNWSIAKDNRGIMYFGNNDGLLEFDGLNWKLNKLTTVRCIAIDSTGRIFVGLENDLGYMIPDSLCNLQFHSLKSLIKESDRNLSWTRTLFINNDTVLFKTRDKLYIYNENEIEVIQNAFGLFKVNNRFIVFSLTENGKPALFFLVKNQLKLIEGTQINKGGVSAIIPFDKNESLLINPLTGIFIFSPDSTVKFYKPKGFNAVDDHILKNGFNSIMGLDKGNYALATNVGGVIIFNETGKIISIYDKASGLQSNTNVSLLFDQNKWLWLAGNGISLIEYKNPYNIFNEQNGLYGTPYCLTYFKNRLYVGTYEYLHILNEQDHFERIFEPKGLVYDLQNLEGHLMLSSRSGLYEVIGNKALRCSGLPITNITCNCQLKNHPGYALSGSMNGLILLKKIDNTWRIIKEVKNFAKPIYQIIEESPLTLWVANYDELYRLKINPDLDRIEDIRQFTIKEGLPKGFVLEYLLNSGEIVFGTSTGIRRYNIDKDILEPHPDFSMITGFVQPFTQISNGDIWYEQVITHGNYEKGELKYINGKYEKEQTLFNKFNDLGSAEGPKSVFITPDSVVYFSSLSGLLKWDMKIKDESFRSPFNTLIRKVNSKHSLLFGGFKYQIENFRGIRGQDLSFRNSDMSFNFAATFYDKPEKTTYSYRLIGFDTAWSVWSSDTKKEYTNLREGNYRFEVKSKNVYQTIGYTASYSFVVLPPWYRAWWAYAIYCILAITLIWIIVRLNIRRLVKQKEHLEKIVKQRTEEVVKQKKQIETAHEEITASINYAKSIQSAVFPKVEQFESLIGEYFILYRPADIVSGDFYWVSEIGSNIIIAAADCTGHGVPGAFMSMLGITLLDEIVNKEQVINPDKILNRLRTEVILSLKQKGELKDQKDGMDIALCTINKENMTLKFSGAINPLYLMRNSGISSELQNQRESTNNEILMEFKGDPMPIGISDNMLNFTLHEIDIQKGDTFYLFTDGFPDQFGGPNHKKFSYKQFKEQLIRTRTNNIADQKLLLENILHDWMGNNKQTDDILVIGFEMK